MSACQSKILLRIESAIGSLLHELQIIWDEVGEFNDERDRILLELEQECLEVFRRKVDQANGCRAQLKQAIADAEAELAAICSAMGERPVHIRQANENPENLQGELRKLLPQIEEMRKKLNNRKNEVFEVLFEVQSIKNEICSSDGFCANEPECDEADLSLKRLEDLHKELEALKKEKSTRQKMTLDRLNSLYSLCIVLGLDFKGVVNKIHPGLEEAESSKNISYSVIEQLGIAIQQLRELKLQRMQQLQDLTTSLLELWNLLDTPIEEQQTFQKVTCKLAASEDEITEADILSIDYINYVAAEVSRLEEFKASKMKELVLKKEAELEAIYRKTHLIPERDSAMERAIHAVGSGAVDADSVLDEIELKIARAKEDALSRKDILEKVEKWMAACEEESWLEKYDRDDNRYNAGRGAHLTLKRAEKARALVNKLTAMVDTLASKILAWENDKGIEFIYDGVRLFTMLEEYKVRRKEKELQRKRQREQKKHQGQFLTEKEALFGSKPSPMKNPNMKKAPRLSYGGASNTKIYLGTPMAQARVIPTAKATPNILTAKKIECKDQKHRKDDRPAPSSLVQKRGPSMVGSTVKQHPVNSLRSRQSELPSSYSLRSRQSVLPSSNSLRSRQSELPSSNSLRSRESELPSSNSLRSRQSELPSSYSLRSRQSELEMKRKPFSPISPATPSKFNTANIMEDLNKKHNELWQRLLTINSTPPRAPSRAEQENRTPPRTMTGATSTPSTVSIPMQTATINSTPPRALSRAEQENRTPPRTMTGATSTPSTVSIPMQTATTPASIQTTTINPAFCSAKSVAEKVEYSFEEMRARSRSPLMNVARVYKL